MCVALQVYQFILCMFIKLPVSNFVFNRRCLCFYPFCLTEVTSESPEASGYLVRWRERFQPSHRALGGGPVQRQVYPGEEAHWWVTFQPGVSNSGIGIGDEGLTTLRFFVA